MSTANSWTRVDESDYLHCCPGAHQYSIFYNRKYTSGQGFQHSDTNNLISNFQKGPHAQSNVLPHRQRAIGKFTEELAALVSRFNPSYSFYLVPTPPSMARTNPYYDSRVEDVAMGVSARLSNINIAVCVETVREIEKSKANLQQRSAERIYDTLAVVPEKLPPDTPYTVALILDDVLTSGAHFEAMRRRLREHLQHADIGGIYWARAVHLDLTELLFGPSSQ